MPWGIPSHIYKRLTQTRRLAPPPPEETLYTWLRHAYETSILISDAPDAATIIKAIARQCKIAGNPNKNRVLVASVCAAHVDSKMMAKYAAVFDWAEINHVAPEFLREFVRKEGGINECVEKVRRS